MTTHPPGGPTGPTGPGRPPIPAADVLDEADAIIAAVGGHLGIGEPHQHSTPPSPLPRLGEVIRDAERLGAQMIAVLGRQWDPASAPEGDVWAGIPVADHNLAVAVSAVRTALAALDYLAALPLPPVGSAVSFPAAAPVAAGESPGGPPVPGAPSSDPSPRHTHTSPEGTGVRRGVGPGVLGSEGYCEPGCPDGCCS